MTLRILRTGYVIVLLLAAAVVAYLLSSGPPSRPLVMLSSNARFVGISAKCTFGTNHVFHYGDSADHTVDLLIGRLSEKYADRIQAYTTEPSTVLWVRM